MPHPIDGIDGFRDLWRDRISRMKLAGKGLCANGLPRYQKLAEQSLKLGADACARFTATKSVR
jgi:hypothetical protein